MAKIGKHDVFLLGADYSFPIKCSSKGIFETEYPQELLGVIETKNYFTNKDALVSEIDAFVKAVNQSSRKVEHLIFYKIEHAASEPHHAFSVNYKRSMLSLDYVFLRLVTVGAKKEYHRMRRVSNEYTEKDMPLGFACGKWFNERELKIFEHQATFSPELALGLEQMDAAIKKLSQNLNSFLTPEKVLELGINGTNLLESKFT